MYLFDFCISYFYSWTLLIICYELNSYVSEGSISNIMPYMEFYAAHSIVSKTFFFVTTVLCSFFAVRLLSWFSTTLLQTISTLDVRVFRKIDKCEVCVDPWKDIIRISQEGQIYLTFSDDVNHQCKELIRFSARSESLVKKLWLDILTWDNKASTWQRSLILPKCRHFLALLVCVICRVSFHLDLYPASIHGSWHTQCWL